MAANVITPSGASVKVATMMDASKASSTDVCPICKSTLQTSPNLRFKVAAKCYHRICEGCVDRKFSAGKAQCPVSGCDKMLWKRDWKVQTYEDVQVIREVDIRRKVFKTLDLSGLGLTEGANGWEDAFEDLRAYNDYLETKEEFAMNLIYNTDVAATNRKIREFVAANGLGREEDGKTQMKPPPPKDGDYPDASGLIKGLKKKFVPKPRSPYNPFMGVEKGGSSYYDDDNDAADYAYDRGGNVERHGPGGYSFSAYMDESLLRAFAGLGVFIEDDKQPSSAPIKQTA